MEVMPLTKKSECKKKVILTIFFISFFFCRWGKVAKELFKVESKSAKEDLKQELGVSYSGIFIYPNLFWHRFFLFFKKCH